MEKLLCKKTAIYPFSTTLNSKSWIAEIGKQRFILKERPHEGLRHEAKYLNFLEENGFKHVPKFYGISAFHGKKILVQEYIKGDKLEGNKSLFYKNCHAIAKILAALHSITKDKHLSCLSLINSEFANMRLSFEQIKVSCLRANNKQMLSALADIEKDIKLLSGVISRYGKLFQEKIHPSLINREVEFIVGQDKKIYLLDWEHAAFGDYAYDIADIKYVFPELDMVSFINHYKLHKVASRYLYIRVLIYHILILIKEYLYYVCDVNCSDVFLKGVPPRIIPALIKDNLATKLENINSLYCKLADIKNP